MKSLYVDGDNRAVSIINTETALLSIITKRNFKSKRIINIKSRHAETGLVG